jgi:hypothetical protein
VTLQNRGRDVEVNANGKYDGGNLQVSPKRWWRVKDWSRCTRFSIL